MDDDLAAFEKSLAAEKAQRDLEATRSKKHRSHRSHRDRHTDSHRDRSRERHGKKDDQEHRRSKRSRRDSSRHGSSRDKGKDRHQQESKDIDGASVSRHDWMTAPSAMSVDYVQRPAAPAEAPKPAAPAQRELPSRELNRGLNNVPAAADSDSEIDYKFGDSGSRWRMVKLDAIYRAAKEEDRPVDEIALERYGSLQAFDIAREEKDELEKRKLYGNGYEIRILPDGHIFNERQKDNSVPMKPPVDDDRPSPGIALRSGIRMPSEQAQAAAPTLAAVPVPVPVDQTALNRMRAAVMKAKLGRAPNAAQLESEYNAAAAAFAAGPPPPKDVILGAMESRLLAGTRGEVTAVTNKRGLHRGTVVENTDMSIQDMVREERRTRGAPGGEAMRLAERIAKDGKFDNDLEYLDENADRLAQRVHKSEVNLKNTAVHEYQKVQRILDNCPLCSHQDRSSDSGPTAPIVSLGLCTYLTLAPEPEISPDSVVIVPKIHHTNLLDCDDDEWEELRNFMKSLTRLYHDQGRDVVFYENAAAPHRRPHAAMVAVPIPYEDGAMVPAYFREAFISADEEWSQHNKVIDTDKAAKDGMGRMAFRRMIAKEAPYFHAWFSLDGGLGHVVENGDKWPRGDLFAREVLGGMMDVPKEVQKKQGRWTRGDRRMQGFKVKWRKFDWTRVLEEGILEVSS